MSALPGKTWLLLGILSIMGIIIKSEGLVYRATNTTKGSPISSAGLLDSCWLPEALQWELPNALVLVPASLDGHWHF